MNRCRTCAAVWDAGDPPCPACGSRNVDRAYTPHPLEDRFRAAVREHLDRLTRGLVAELAALATRTYEEEEADEGAEVYLLDFEVHSPDFADRFPVQVFPTDAENNQVGDPIPLLAGAGPALPGGVFDSPDLDGADTRDLAFRALIPWFTDCWRAAGGPRCRYPAYLGHHDSGLAWDLAAGRWVRAADKFPGDG